MITVRVSYKEFDRAFDKRLEKLAGKHSDGSGYDMLYGERDLSFSFRDRTKAYAVARLMAKLKTRKNNLKISTED